MGGGWSVTWSGGCVLTRLWGRWGISSRPATSEMAVFTRDPKRFFDLDAVRTEPQGQPGYESNGPKDDEREALGVDGVGRMTKRIDSHAAGAPPLDWWKITTSGYSGSHYATYPQELCVVPVKSMCPERVCVVCGEPSRRITQEWRTLDGERVERGAIGDTERMMGDPDGVGNWRKATERETVGWSDCGHNHWRNGHVLDPFAGSGTTLAVATGHGRDATGIDLDSRNAELALDRVGPMFLTVV